MDPPERCPWPAAQDLEGISTTGGRREDRRGPRDGSGEALPLASGSRPARPGGEHHHRPPGRSTRSSAGIRRGGRPWPAAHHRQRPGEARHHLQPVNSPALPYLKKLNLDRLRPSDFITTDTAREDRRGPRDGSAEALPLASGSRPARPGGEHHHRPGEDRRGPRDGSGAAVDPGQRLITGNDREAIITTGPIIFSDKKTGTHNRAPVILLPTKSFFFKYAGTPIFQKCYPQCYPRGF